MPRTLSPHRFYLSLTVLLPSPCCPSTALRTPQECRRPPASSGPGSPPSATLLWGQKRSAVGLTPHRARSTRLWTCRPARGVLHKGDVGSQTREPGLRSTWVTLGDRRAWPTVVPGVERAHGGVGTGPASRFTGHRGPRPANEEREREAPEPRPVSELGAGALLGKGLSQGPVSTTPGICYGG